MKKYCFILTAILAAVIFCGCDGGNEKDFAKITLMEEYT